MRYFTKAAVPAVLGLILAGCRSGTETWSDTKTARESDDIPSAHGNFKAQPVSVTTTGLKEHRMVRLRFRLILKGTWDGNRPDWGPDLLGCRVREGEQLFFSTFSTAGANSRYFTQSFPDDFPRADHLAFTGGTPLENTPFRISSPEHKAAFSDVAYDFDATIPHRGDSLTLDFCPLFTDPNQDNQYWAIANFSCETAPDPTPLDAATLEKLWTDMADPDSPKAVAAMWSFVAAGEHSTEFLLAKYATLANWWDLENPPAHNTPEALRLNRLQRALRLIGTRETLAAGDGMSYKVFPRETGGNLFSR